MSTEFDFSAVYDTGTIRCAALALFRNQQRRNLAMTLGSTTLVAICCIASALYLHYYWLLWAPLPFLVADVLMRFYIRHRVISKISQGLVGQSVRFRMTEDAFAFSLNGADHKMPWTHFLKVERERLALLLYLSRFSAVIVPVASAPAGAVEFAAAHATSNA